MKTWQVEDLFFKHFNIPNSYTGQHIKDLKYLQLASLILEYGSVKNFKEKILFQCIEYKDEIKEQVDRIFCKQKKSANVREMMSKIKCSICGSKEVTMIDHTNNYAFCYRCMPDVVYKDGFEFRKIRQEVNNDMENN